MLQPHHLPLVIMCPAWDVQAISRMTEMHLHWFWNQSSDFYERIHVSNTTEPDPLDSASWFTWSSTTDPAFPRDQAEADEGYNHYEAYEFWHLFFKKTQYESDDEADLFQNIIDGLYVKIGSYIKVNQEYKPIMEALGVWYP